LKKCEFFVHLRKYVGSEKDSKRIRIRKEVKSRIRIWIQYYLKVRSGSGSEIDWKVGSRSKINNFGSATLLFQVTYRAVHRRLRMRMLRPGYGSLLRCLVGIPLTNNWSQFFYRYFQNAGIGIGGLMIHF